MSITRGDTGLEVVLTEEGNMWYLMRASLVRPPVSLFYSMDGILLLTKLNKLSGAYFSRSGTGVGANWWLMSRLERERPGILAEPA